MGYRKVIIKQSAADNIAQIAWFIESKGMIATADKFAQQVYDFFVKLSSTTVSFAECREKKEHFLDTNVCHIKKSTL